MNGFANRYQSNQVQNAPPEKILLMLYDGAIRFVRRAENAMDEKNIEEKNIYINKTSAIVAELAATLDHEVGGSLATDLHRLYMYMIGQLSRGNASNNKNYLLVVERLLVDLRVTWGQAVETYTREKKAGAVPPRDHADQQMKMAASAL